MDYVISITEMLKLISDGITDMNKSNNHNKLNRKKMENCIQFFKLKKKSNYSELNKISIWISGEDGNVGKCCACLQ